MAYLSLIYFSFDQVVNRVFCFFCFRI